MHGAQAHSHSPARVHTHAHACRHTYMLPVTAHTPLTHTLMQIYTGTHPCTHVHTHARTHTHLHLHMFMDTHTLTQKSTYGCIHTARTYPLTHLHFRVSTLTHMHMHLITFTIIYSFLFPPSPHTMHSHPLVHPHTHTHSCMRTLLHNPTLMQLLTRSYTEMHTDPTPTQTHSHTVIQG